MRRPCLAVMAVSTIILSATAARAVEPPSCAILDRAFPQPGRGIGGYNAYRPLPVMAPIRSQAGAPGTLSLSIGVDHVSGAQAGYPGYVYVGNYQVTDLPVFRQVVGANTSLTVTSPDDGRVYAISNLCLNGPEWGFGGTEWSLVQADTLDVLLQSHLDYTGTGSVGRPVNGGVPCRSSNLHTHGLLVTPYHPQRAGTGPYGDYVLDTTQPRGSLGFGTNVDDCGTNLGQTEHRGHGLTDLPLHYDDAIPGHPGVNSLASGEHPSGLFWYHPHPHGYSRTQISGGTTGPITIGDLTDYACPTGDGSPGHCTITNTNIRVMVLKDTELQTYNQYWGLKYLPESQLCAPLGGTRHGECQGSESKSGPTKWVFTINGVEYPVVHVPAGKMEIWRIVNASQGVTYSLSLRQLGEDNNQAELPYQLLARDGVAISQHDKKGVMRTQLLLMPASRVEIAIPAPPNGGTFILHNDIAQTGGNTSGNTWPAIDLASFTWAKPLANAAPSEPRPVILQAAAATPIPKVEQVVNGEKGVCTFVPGDKRLVYFVHRFIKVPRNGATASPVQDSSEAARQTNEVFGLIAGVQHVNGSIDFFNDLGKPVLHTAAEVWNAGIHDGDPAFPAFGHNPWGTICTVKGNVEPWLLTNYTGEDHNFHLHQSKFSIDPNGEFQYPLPSEPMPNYLRHTDQQVKDYSDPAITAYADTVPVPRGQSPCAGNPNAAGCQGLTTHECSGAPTDAACTRPGKLSLIVGFTRAEQVGTYVYHCHIMEHEDGGMMAMIRVLCPKGDASCASQQAQQAICRPPAE